MIHWPSSVYEASSSKMVHLRKVSGKCKYSYFVWLCAFHVESCLALWSPRLGKRELVYVLLVHMFVYFAGVNVCHFSLPLGVGGRLRIVTVAVLIIICLQFWVCTCFYNRGISCLWYKNYLVKGTHSMRCQSKSYINQIFLKHFL